MVVGVVVMPRSNPELAAKMGKRMVIRRKELGLTQEQVAELAGIAHQQYNKAEKGKTCLGSDTLNRISAALNISADYLLTGILSAKQARSFALIMEKTDAITLYSSFILNNFPNETY